MIQLDWHDCIPLGVMKNAFASLVFFWHCLQEGEIRSVLPQNKAAKEKGPPTKQPTLISKEEL
jgi:hypothetical protein